MCLKKDPSRQKGLQMQRRLGENVADGSRTSREARMTGMNKVQEHSRRKSSQRYLG